MRRVERRCHLNDQVRGAVNFDRTGFPYQLPQVRARYEIHHKEQQTVVLIRVAHCDHVWMAKRGGKAHLSREASPELFLAGDLRGEDL